MESSEKTVNGWNEHAKLVLSELKRLNDRLESIDTSLDTRFTRHQQSIQIELKDLESKVADLQLTLAVLKKDVALKTSGIAFGISFVISVILKYIGKI